MLFQKDVEVYLFCEDCAKAWSEDVNHHPDHKGTALHFPGIFIQQEFVSVNEECRISEEIYKIPFVDSQSGRRKQVGLFLGP